MRLIPPLILVLVWAASPAHAQQNVRGIDITVTAGEQFTRAVAAFEHPMNHPPEFFPATIDWGDGSPEGEGDVVSLGPSPAGFAYEVRGTHTYADPGTRTIAVTLEGPDGGQQTVNATATVQAPAGPPPPPPPPAPPPLVATLQTSASGPMLALDASGSTGPIAGYHFDLDGNGSFETPCDGPKATALHSKAGPKNVGVKIVAPGGGSQSAAGTATTGPPGGGTAKLPKGVTSGACDEDLPASFPEKQAALLMCPATLRFGVAELAMPPDAPPGACFGFVRLSANQLLGGGFGSKETVPAWRAPAGQRVFANGLLLRPGQTGARLAATASPAGMRVIGLKPAPKVGLKAPVKTGGLFDVALLHGDLIAAGDVAPLAWDVSKPGIVQTVPDFDGLLFRLILADFDSPLRLTKDARAELPVVVEFPLQDIDLLLAGTKVTSGPIELRTANGEGPEVTGLKASFPSMPLGILTLDELTIAYSLEGGKHVWEGAMKVSVSGYELTGNARFVNGSLDGANVAGTFPGPGIPLGCCIYLNKIGAGFEDFEILGSARFVVPPKVISPWLLQADTQVRLSYGDPWNVKAGGEFSVVGFPFATADLFVWPGGGWAQGLIDADFGPFNVDIGAQLYLGSKWYAKALGSGCFDWIDGACIKVGAAASTKAITACGAIGDYLAIGGWYKWSGSAGIYFDCGWGVLDETAGIARAAGADAAPGTAGARGARAGAPLRLRVPRGLRRTLFRFRGRGAPPRVEVVAPDGRRFTSPARGGFATDRRSFSWIEDGRDVYLTVARPRGGVWRIEEAGGSPPIASVARAGPLPRRPVRARVGGRGHRRVLRYTIDPTLGGRVSFFESGGRGGPSSPIGTARGTRGALRFTPAEGPAGARRIYAVMESRGLPRGTRAVARYRAPGPLRPGRVRPRVRRRGDALVVSWRRVAGARRYVVGLQTGDGRGRTWDTRRRRVVARGVSARTRALVEVRALSRTAATSRVGRKRLRPLPALSRVRLGGAPRELRLADLLSRGGLAFRCAATADGRCALTLRRGRRIVARGSSGVRYGGTATVRLRTTRSGRRVARRGGRMILHARLPGEPERRIRVAVPSRT